jgi:hypothetical protein
VRWARGAKGQGEGRGGKRGLRKQKPKSKKGIRTRRLFCMPFRLLNYASPESTFNAPTYIQAAVDQEMQHMSRLDFFLSLPIRIFLLLSSHGLFNTLFLTSCLSFERVSSSCGKEPGDPHEAPSVQQSNLSIRKKTKNTQRIMETKRERSIKLSIARM